MAKCYEAETLVDLVTGYISGLPPSHVVLATDYDALAAELAEIKLQRDSWKRIAESGLGLPSETKVDDCCPKCDSEICICGLGSEPAGSEPKITGKP